MFFSFYQDGDSNSNLTVTVLNLPFTKEKQKQTEKKYNTSLGEVKTDQPIHHKSNKIICHYVPYLIK